MTIGEVRAKYSAGISGFDFDQLCAFCLKKNREFVLSHPEEILSAEESANLKKLIKKRQAGYSLAFLLGQKSFYGLNFNVDKNVLIPRPETELMVDKTISCIAKKPNDTTVIDVGTGSGCIAISLAKNIKNKNINFYGLDISSKALKIARQNAKLNKVENIIFQKSNLLSSLLKSQISNQTRLANGQESQIVITANLPYLAPGQIKNSPSIKKEPRLALVAGTDGLKYYRKLFRQISKLKKKHPEKSLLLFCEIDDSQKKTIQTLAKQILKIDYKLDIKKDLRGENRLVVIEVDW